MMIADAKKPNLTQDVIDEVEKETSSLIFFDDGAITLGIEGSSRLLVCSHDQANRAAAVRQLEKRQHETPVAKKSWADDDDDDDYSWKEPKAYAKAKASYSW